jgi:ParB-like chromosome segregation protein Spo0J
MQIEHWRLDQLKPYENNARTHSPEQVGKLARSIKQFGFNNPIVVDGRTRTILAGHGRLAAAKHLGLETVPVVPVQHLTELERRAYILADNRLAEESFWDKTLLADELDKIQDDELVGAIGFNPDQLSAVMGDDSVLEEGQGELREDLDVDPDPAEGGEKLKKVDKVTIRVGEIRFLVTVEEYISWRAGVRASVGLSSRDIVDHILEQIGLC